MDTSSISEELDRLRRRDSKQIKILGVGYILATLFGFLAVITVLNSIENKYESRFNEFKAETENLKIKAKNDFMTLREEILVLVN